MLAYDYSMDLNLQKEQFSNAFLQAVAAVAECAAAKPSVDDDSVDWTVSCRLPRRPKLDVQLKATAEARGDGEEFGFWLKRKNYIDLSARQLIVPRILVVVFVPAEVPAWVESREEEMILRHRAYWVSLAGADELEEDDSGKTVHIPRVQVFDPPGLISLMERVNREEAI